MIHAGQLLGPVPRVPNGAEFHQYGFTGNDGPLGSQQSMPYH